MANQVLCQLNIDHILLKLKKKNVKENEKTLSLFWLMSVNYVFSHIQIFFPSNLTIK